MRHPNADDVDAVVLDSIDDVVLGAAVINNLCHVILKDRGICVLRRLPQHFDLKFWKKYHQSLLQLDGGLHDNLKKAFLSFCSKDLVSFFLKFFFLILIKFLRTKQKNQLKL